MDSNENSQSNTSQTDSPSTSRIGKLKKRSLVERELETNLTAVITSPILIRNSSPGSTSRYGRARNLKSETELSDTEKKIPKLLNSTPIPSNKTNFNASSISSSSKVANQSAAEIDEQFRMEALSEYQVGDLAWARISSYPFWPCIVTRDPNDGTFLKKKDQGKREKLYIHVVYFGDNGRRGWISDRNMRKFLGVAEFEKARDQFTPEAKKKDAKLYAAFLVSEKKHPKWRVAADEAEMLLKKPKRIRIEILNDMLISSRQSKIVPKKEKKSKITRKDSDVSLSESLYDSLFSEDDSKNDSSEGCKKKTLDVSDVVTACLDNMAAKSGMNIQKQSHMDRWLQKAKSKAPIIVETRSLSVTDNKAKATNDKSRKFELRRKVNIEHKRESHNRSLKQKKKNVDDLYENGLHDDIFIRIPERENGNTTPEKKFRIFSGYDSGSDYERFFINGDIEHFNNGKVYVNGVKNEYLENGVCVNNVINFFKKEDNASFDLNEGLTSNNTSLNGHVTNDNSANVSDTQDCKLDIEYHINGIVDSDHNSSKMDTVTGGDDGNLVHVTNSMCDSYESDFSKDTNDEQGVNNHSKNTEIVDLGVDSTCSNISISLDNANLTINNSNMSLHSANKNEVIVRGVKENNDNKSVDCDIMFHVSDKCINMVQTISDREFNNIISDTDMGKDGNEFYDAAGVAVENKSNTNVDELNLGIERNIYASKTYLSPKSAMTENRFKPKDLITIANEWECNGDATDKSVKTKFDAELKSELKAKTLHFNKTDSADEHPAKYKNFRNKSDSKIKTRYNKKNLIDNEHKPMEVIVDVKSDANLKTRLKIKKLNIKEQTTPEEIHPAATEKCLGKSDGKFKSSTKLNVNKIHNLPEKSNIGNTLLNAKSDASINTKLRSKDLNIKMSNEIDVNKFVDNGSGQEARKELIKKIECTGQKSNTDVVDKCLDTEVNTDVKMTLRTRTSNYNVSNITRETVFDPTDKCLDAGSAGDTGTALILHNVNIYDDKAAEECSKNVTKKSLDIKSDKVSKINSRRSRKSSLDQVNISCESNIDPASTCQGSGREGDPQTKSFINNLIISELGAVEKDKKTVTVESAVTKLHAEVKTRLRTRNSNLNLPSTSLETKIGVTSKFGDAGRGADTRHNSLNFKEHGAFEKDNSDVTGNSSDSKLDSKVKTRSKTKSLNFNSLDISQETNIDAKHKCHDNGNEGDTVTKLISHNLNTGRADTGSNSLSFKEHNALEKDNSDVTGNSSDSKLDSKVKTRSKTKSFNFNSLDISQETNIDAKNNCHDNGNEGDTVTKLISQNLNNYGHSASETDKENIIDQSLCTKSDAKVKTRLHLRNAELNMSCDSNVSKCHDTESESADVDNSDAEAENGLLAGYSKFSEPDASQQTNHDTREDHTRTKSIASSMHDEEHTTAAKTIEIAGNSLNCKPDPQITTNCLELNIPETSMKDSTAVTVNQLSISEKDNCNVTYNLLKTNLRSRDNMETAMCIKKINDKMTKTKKCHESKNSKNINPKGITDDELNISEININANQKCADTDFDAKIETILTSNNINLQNSDNESTGTNECLVTQSDSEILPKTSSETEILVHENTSVHKRNVNITNKCFDKETNVVDEGNNLKDNKFKNVHQKMLLVDIDKANSSHAGIKSTKLNSNFDDPEFLNYVELKQDSLIDEHPDLSQEHITEFLYKTWVYELGLKNDEMKVVEANDLTLVKDSKHKRQSFKNKTKKLPKKIKVQVPKYEDVSVGHENRLPSDACIAAPEVIPTNCDVSTEVRSLLNSNKDTRQEENTKEKVCADTNEKYIEIDRGTDLKDNKFENVQQKMLLVDIDEANSSCAGIKSIKLTSNFEDPEFLNYVELKQNSLIDEHPDLSQEHITEFLYKTWLYELGLKNDEMKVVEANDLTLVKGSRQSFKKETKKPPKKIKVQVSKNEEVSIRHQNRLPSVASIAVPEVIPTDCDVSTEVSLLNSKKDVIKDEFAVDKVCVDEKEKGRQIKYDDSCVIVLDKNRLDVILGNDERKVRNNKDVKGVAVVATAVITQKESTADDFNKEIKTGNIQSKMIQSHVVKLQEKGNFDSLTVNAEIKELVETDKFNDVNEMLNTCEDVSNVKVTDIAVNVSSINSHCEDFEDNIPKATIKKPTKNFKDPEFLKYVELRKDTLFDDNPELSEDDKMSYLYMSWNYEQNNKTDEMKNDDLQHSSLVKGVKEEVSQPQQKKIKRKPKPDKGCKDTDSDEPLICKKVPRRKIAVKPYYNEVDEFSDSDIDFDTKDLKPENKAFVNEGMQPTVDIEQVDVIEDSWTEYDEVEYFFSQLTVTKPNVFKGLMRERVCDVCERTGNLIKCKGPCAGRFHIDCARKPPTEVVEQVLPPTRGRKKKPKVIRKLNKSLTDHNDSSESQSDEKSQDRTQDTSLDDADKSIDGNDNNNIVAAADVFEAQIEATMKELLENKDTEECEYLYSSDEELHWNKSIPGQCEIIELKPRPKVVNMESLYADFKCNYCLGHDIPLCFVCKKEISPKNNINIRQKCSVPHCNKYYHLECLEQWPQTQYKSGEPSRNKKNVEEAITCPHHVCHTCICDDPRGCKSRFSGDKLAKCVRCPAVYHSFTKCLPAGSTILTASHIICPRHFEHRPGKVPFHVNTGWCFICALGGTLICCEYCPTSFHAECLNIKPPEGNYMCEDCETGRLPLYGEMVWVKLGHYRWWPGLILHPTEIPDNVMSIKHNLGEFCVRFFGQYDHYWVNRGRVFPFQEGDSGRVSSQKSKLDAAFTRAMEDAQKACEILKTVQPDKEESNDIASSVLPPHYVKLKVNKPCGSLVNWKPDTSEASLTQCECDPLDADPCGPDSCCLNRMLLTECGPTCRAGDRCNNRSFEKRQYPKMAPYRTPQRGWGLRALEEIKKGQFVIEYVGELIDGEEFRRRMRRKHEMRDENFYFLTLDKDRMIDAGPKGNLARFMNHCCEPNCETQKWTVLGDVRVGLFAMDDIPANTEVTFNYNLESAGIEKKQCMCGAKRCSGYIGAKPKQEEKQRLTPKRVYKKRKQPTSETPSTSQNQKTPKSRHRGRPRTKELSDLEKDLIIIKNAINSISNDIEQLESIKKDKSVKPLKRKRVSFSNDGSTDADNRSPSVKKLKTEESSLPNGDV